MRICFHADPDKHFRTQGIRIRLRIQGFEVNNTQRYSTGYKDSSVLKKWHFATKNSTIVAHKTLTLTLGCAGRFFSE
jgi:hypothetical protein